MNTWLRWYHGTTTDPKWRVVAQRAKRPVGMVVSIWAAMLEKASECSDRGTIDGFNAEDVAAAYDYDVADVEAVVKAMQGKVIDGDRLTGWEKRNPKREDPNVNQRVQEYRDRKRNVTQSNDREEEIRREETREENRNQNSRPSAAECVVSDAPPASAREQGPQKQETPRRVTSKPNPPTIPDDSFEKLWARYPAGYKDGRKAAERHFSASVKTEQDLQDIHRALDNYFKDLKIKDWKRPKNGDTWFNNWRDWIDYKEPEHAPNANTRTNNPKPTGPVFVPKQR